MRKYLDRQSRSVRTFTCKISQRLGKSQRRNASERLAYQRLVFNFRVSLIRPKNGAFAGAAGFRDRGARGPRYMGILRRVASVNITYLIRRIAGASNSPTTRFASPSSSLPRVSRGICERDSPGPLLTRAVAKAFANTVAWRPEFRRRNGWHLYAFCCIRRILGDHNAPPLNVTLLHSLDGKSFRDL